VNLALNIVRTRKRRQASSDIETLEAVAAADTSHLESIQEEVMDAIAQLNPPMVEMLILRYGHNYSDAEIARMLGKSRGTVAVSLYRARTRLKRLLRDGETQ
jgi:RNA polymerase sigma factor (sigma-70 family)